LRPTGSKEEQREASEKQKVRKVPSSESLTCIMGRSEDGLAKQRRITHHKSKRLLRRDHRASISKGPIPPQQDGEQHSGELAEGKREKRPR